MQVKFSSVITILGAILFAIATLFHPPLTNPWDLSFAFQEVSKHEHWILDHWVFLIGLTLWLIGLALLADSVITSSPVLRNSARFFIGALTLWYVILAAELAILPQMTNQILVGGNTNRHGMLFLHGGYLQVI